MIRQGSIAAVVGTAIPLLFLSSCGSQPVAPARDGERTLASAKPPSQATTEPREPQPAPSPPAQTPVLEAAGSEHVPTDEPPAVVEEPNERIARADEPGPQRRTASYRADVNQPSAIPPVVLSKAHEALCEVKVGDTMPQIELEELGGGPRRLVDLAGEKATVVVFWKSDRHMARQELADLGPDIVEPFGQLGVAVVSIAVNEPTPQVQDSLQRAGAPLPTLIDANGDAFAKVGSEKLPRTYLLDPQGKILWFDLEYSHTTRRELHQALRAVTSETTSGEPASAGGQNTPPQ